MKTILSRKGRIGSAAMQPSALVALLALVALFALLAPAPPASAQTTGPAGATTTKDTTTTTTTTQEIAAPTMPPFTHHPSDTISTDTVELRLISELVIRDTNRERQKAGLGRVEKDSVLHQVAEEHSRDMAARNYFSHTTQSRGGKPEIPFEQRVSAEKLGYRRTGENIALQPIIKSETILTRTSSTGEVTREVTPEIATYDELSTSTLDGWMKSPGHRANILTPEFNRIGVGVAIGTKDGSPYVYLTQNFGQKE